MNPCPCGWYGTNRCTCAKERVQQYLRRLSGPLLDRIDLHDHRAEPVEYEAHRRAQPRTRRRPPPTVQAPVNAARDIRQRQL